MYREVCLRAGRVTVRPGYSADLPEIVCYFVRNQVRLAPYVPTPPDNFYSEAHWLSRLREAHTKRDFRTTGDRERGWCGISPKRIFAPGAPGARAYSCVVGGAHRARYEAQVVVDYVSPHGRRVTDVRAIVVQGVHAQLKAAGHYDDYLRYFPAVHAERASQSLASTWIPVASLVAHYQALERMHLSDTQIASLAEQLGANLFDQLFTTIVRAIRAAGGGSGIWFGFKQTDRVWSRMYNGGACRIEQVGPKDALYTISGLPGIGERASRLSQCAFMRGVMSISTKACVVKVVASSQPAPDTLTLAISWV